MKTSYQTSGVVDQIKKQTAAINQAMNPTNTMKTDKELGEIGAAAALLKQREQLTGNLCIVPEYAMWQADESARTAFAAAVREEIFAGMEGMPSEGVCLETYGLEISRNGYICGVNAVRKLMLAAFAKQMEEAKNNSLLLCKELGNEGKTTIGELQSKLSEAEERVESKHGCWMNALKKVTELESKLAEAEKRLGELEWRPVSVKPMREDGNDNGIVMIMDHDGNMSTIAYNLFHRLEPKWKWWMPYFKPPTPTAEEIERAEFEEWAQENCPGWSLSKSETGQYQDPNARVAFAGWQARAAKEVKA